MDHTFRDENVAEMIYHELEEELKYDQLSHEQYDSYCSNRHYYVLLYIMLAVIHY